MKRTFFLYGWAAVCCQLIVCTLRADTLQSEFFRALSTEPASGSIELSSDGWLSWPNLGTGKSILVERSFTLSAPAWEPFARGVTSNETLNVKVMDRDVPRGFRFIPGGVFTMGDILNDYGYLIDVHPVFLSPFFMQTHEVTASQFAAFLQWAYDRQLVTVITNYVLDSQGTNLMALNRNDSEISFVFETFQLRTGRENFPANLMTWFGAVTYCNWLSQQQGYESCYNLTNWTCDFSKLGYRLPTEAEWEYAARGGYEGKRFPWPDTDTITQSRANYRSNTNVWYDVSPTRGLHPDYADTSPHSSPVGSFAPNNYGLYDMSGNVWEWVWDRAARYPRNYQVNPVGPESGTTRILRGGSWSTAGETETCAGRYIGLTPTSTVFDVGLRPVLPFRPPSPSPRPTP